MGFLGILCDAMTIKEDFMKDEANREKNLPHSKAPVDRASEDSFPASDPPAWTGTTTKKSDIEE